MFVFQEKSIFSELQCMICIIIIYLYLFKLLDCRFSSAFTSIGYTFVSHLSICFTLLQATYLLCDSLLQATYLLFNAFLQATYFQSLILQRKNAYYL